MKKFYKWLLKLVIKHLDRNNDGYISSDEVIEKIKDVLDEINW